MVNLSNLFFSENSHTEWRHFMEKGRNIWRTWTFDRAWEKGTLVTGPQRSWILEHRKNKSRRWEVKEKLCFTSHTCPPPAPSTPTKTRPAPQLCLFIMAGREELTPLNAPESQPGWGLKAAHWSSGTNLPGEPSKGNLSEMQWHT